MSFRPGLLPNLLRAAKPSATFTRAFHRPSQAHSQVLTMARQRPAFRLSQFLFPLALGTTYMTYNSLSHPAKCDSFLSGVTGPTPEVGGGNPPTSELSGYQLGFGAVCGVCTGVFVKKGLKAIAFLLGGCFILMQYMSSRSFIKVDWSKLAGGYDKTFGTKTPTGEIRAPTAGGIYSWFVDFVTANFQQRATFLAGFALGMRLG